MFIIRRSSLNERISNNNHLIGTLPRIITSHDNFRSPITVTSTSIISPTCWVWPWLQPHQVLDHRRAKVAARRKIYSSHINCCFVVENYFGYRASTTVLGPAGQLDVPLHVALPHGPGLVRRALYYLLLYHIVLYDSIVSYYWLS